MCIRNPLMMLRQLGVVEAWWRKTHLTFRRTAGFPVSINGTNSREIGFTICHSETTGGLFPKAHGVIFWVDGNGAVTSRWDPDCTSRRACWAEGWTLAAAGSGRSAQ